MNPSPCPAVKDPRHRTPYAHLPLYARVAIELADCCAIPCTTAAVEASLAPEAWVRESVLHICRRLFFNFDAA
jgi:hypothetical protein